jgi:acetyl-CoA acetyltransferase
MAQEAALAALADAGIRASEVGLVVVGNALGGRLVDQGCIRGQTWLRDIGLSGAPMVNVDNSCASGSSAFYLGVQTATSGSAPVLVVGVEKMWTGDRWNTLAGIEDGLPRDERAPLHAKLDAVCDAGSLLMGLNSTWLVRQMEEGRVTLEQVAATAVKARESARRNPTAQYNDPDRYSSLTIEEVLAAPPVAGLLTRPMCSSFTDGAASVVLSTVPSPGSPSVIASVAKSGNGDIDYHERLSETAQEAWKQSGIGPADLDIIELHDATSAEELYALESLGFFAPGDAGPATVAGDTDLGGKGIRVNPSGGLVGRGHPLGATGVAQIVEITDHLRGRAGARQRPDARLGVAVNTGGIIGGDAAFVGIQVLKRG